MIVFCGYANLDVVGRVPRFPRPDERVHATAVDHLHGGMAANAAVAAARAGAGVAFAGVLGADPLSDLFLDQLRRDGVDPGWSDRSAFLSTAIVLVDAEGRRSVVSEDDALDETHVVTVADRLARAGGGMLYLDGYRAAAVAAAVRQGSTIAVDLDGCDDQDTALDAMRHADHVLLGRRRLEEVLGLPAASWPELAVAGGTHLVVTDGANGWTLAGPDGSVVHGRALAVPVLDDTGAGDCFAGTYLAGLADGRPPAEATTRAAVAASLSCTVAGARGAPQPAEVDVALDRLMTAS